MTSPKSAKGYHRSKQLLARLNTHDPFVQLTVRLKYQAGGILIHVLHVRQHFGSMSRVVTLGERHADVVRIECDEDNESVSLRRQRRPEEC